MASIWLREQLEQALGWEEFLLDGIVQAIEAASSADAVEDIVDNFAEGDPAVKGVVAEYFRRRKQADAASSPPRPAEPAGHSRGSRAAAKEEHASQSLFAAVAASRAGDALVGEPDQLQAYLKHETEVDVPGLTQSTRGGKGQPSYKSAAQPRVEFASAASEGGLAPQARDRNEVLDRRGLAFGANVAVGRAKPRKGRGGKTKDSDGDKPEAPVAGADLVIERRVLNCLECGRIFDLREVTPEALAFLRSGGQCTFCRAQVRLRYLSADAPEDAGIRLDKATREALQFKDRLVDYDRTAAQRTAVIDDQGDYYGGEGSAWLSAEERRELAEREERRIAEEEARRRMVSIRIDVLGRQLVVSERPPDAAGSSSISGPDAALRGAMRAAALATAAETAHGGGTAAWRAAEGGGGPGPDHGFRIRANPDLLVPTPLYLPAAARQSRDAGAGGAQAADAPDSRPGHARGGPKRRARGGGAAAALGSGRLQSDDPMYLLDERGGVADLDGLTRQLAPWRLEGRSGSGAIQ